MKYKRVPNINPEIKAEWVARLRSGEYEQGTFFLNTSGRFCCWGVLCEIATEQGVVHKEELAGGYGFKYEGDSCTPPTEVLEWAGVQEVAKTVALDGSDVSPICANDTYGWDFKRIADGLEANW